LVIVDRIFPKHLPFRRDGGPMTPDDIHELRDWITSLENITWIDEATREIVEKFMPELVDRLPERTTETFDKAFGKMRASAQRKTTAKDHLTHKRPRDR
jgi:hypothetical protein